MKELKNDCYHFEIIGKNPKVFELLLKNGANANIESKNGDTPLGFALSDGNEQILNLLLEKTDVNRQLKNMNGMTLLHRAVKNGTIASQKLTSFKICAIQSIL